MSLISRKFSNYGVMLTDIGAFGAKPLSECTNFSVLFSNMSFIQNEPSLNQRPLCTVPSILTLKHSII